MPPVLAAVLQTEVKGAFANRGKMKENLRHACELIDRAVNGTAQASRGQPPKLVAFPESFLHGFGPMRTRTYATNSSMASPIPNEETAVLGAKAREYGMYIVGCMFEVDPDFPNHFFNTAFILDPEGKVALKYRKINSSNNNIELSTSPGDVLARYGDDPEKLFPVLRTPFGNIGVYICYDALFPEVARCLALNGAEILIRPMGPTSMSGTANSLDQWILTNRIRALENNAYVLAPHWADSPESEYAVSDGHSMVVDYNGQVIAESVTGRPTFVAARLDIDGLRRRRAVDYGPYLVQLRSELYARVYAAKACWPSPADGYKERGLQNQDEKWEIIRQVHQDLVRRGILS